MTEQEQEWLTCAHSGEMLVDLRGKASDRKLRLFAVACCRRIWHLMTDERSRRAVELADQFADGKVTLVRLSLANIDANTVANGRWHWDCHTNAAHVATNVSSVEESVRLLERAANTARSVAYALADELAGSPSKYAEERAKQCVMVRCIFGNPFRTVSLHDVWLSSTVSNLAESIYNERAFERMPILGDALEDAGCASEEILNHCRQPGEHVRGCWVVDLILSKDR